MSSGSATTLRWVLLLGGRARRGGAAGNTPTRVRPLRRAAADVLVAQAILAYEEKHYEEALATLYGPLQANPTEVEALTTPGSCALPWGVPTRLPSLSRRLEPWTPRTKTILFQFGVVYFNLATSVMWPRPLMSPLTDALFSP